MSKYDALDSHSGNTASLLFEPQQIVYNIKNIHKSGSISNPDRNSQLIHNYILEQKATVCNGIVVFLTFIFRY